jgi:SAM-dependent methyltransferase
MIQTFLRRYAGAEADTVVPFVVGRTVLDLGAGEGYVAAALRERTGLWICSVDVGRFRRAPGPYVAYDGTRLPFNAAFDTTLLLLTLHHSAESEAVLDEALRVTRFRLIITESVYRNRLDRFWLDHLDGWLNRRRHDGEMRVPRAFRRPEDWLRLFRSRDLRVVEARWLGSWVERLVHHPLLFVLDKSGSRSLDSLPRAPVDSIAHIAREGRIKDGGSPGRAEPRGAPARRRCDRA